MIYEEGSVFGLELIFEKNKDRRAKLVKLHLVYLYNQIQYAISVMTREEYRQWQYEAVIYE